MLAKSVLAALVGFIAASEAASVNRPFDALMAKRGRRDIRGGTPVIVPRQSSAAASSSPNAGDLTLRTDSLSTASASDGSPSDGESASSTDNANFINFCSGKTITNGQQNEGGSCNPVVMGDIPSTDRMITAMLISPQHNDDLDPDTTFNAEIQIDNLAAGSFTNADSTYYTAPQQLDGNGQIIGHTHIVIQDMGDSLTSGQTLDPNEFVFFKGIDDAGDGNGGLSVAVDGGLPEGNYRICSMTGASNHQPALMPIAQRGPQDDCNKFTVGGGSNSKKSKNRGFDDDDHHHHHFRRNDEKKGRSYRDNKKSSKKGRSYRDN